jgi:hypothetical protein
MRLTYRASLALLLVIGTACHDGIRAAPPILLEIAAQGDPGAPLVAVPIRIDGESVGVTGADGTLRLPVVGEPGHVLRIAHDCPAGHRAPRKAELLRIRRYDRDRTAPIQINLECRPLTRIAAFVVRAKNGAHLPVRVNDELVATTNSFGVAHFSTRGRPGSEYLVELDASGDPTLLPHSVVTQFRLPDANELFVVTPSFQAADPLRKAHRRQRRIIKIE